MVSVEVAEASSVEEGLVVRLVGRQGAGGEGFVREFIDPLPALDLQLQDASLVAAVSGISLLVIILNYDSSTSIR